MVAITVILAAVIGTFVIGLGDSVQQQSPSASFAGDQGPETIGGTDFSSLTVTHEGGDSVDESNLDVEVNGENAFGVFVDGGANTTIDVWNNTDEVSAGNSVTVVAYGDSINNESSYTVSGSQLNANGGSVTDVGLSSGDTVRVTWSSDDGSNSQTLFSRDIN